MLAFNVRFYDDWKLENWLTVPFVVLLYATHRWFRLSDISYLGSQGDVWDAQKDMALAGLGSVITMTIVLFVRLAYDRAGFGRELGESLRVKRREVMGEQALERLPGLRDQ